MNAALWRYILRRILWMVPTLLGVITLTFAVIQFVPGGPVEQMMLELKGRGEASVGAVESSGGGSTYRGRQGIDEERLKEIKALYGFDQPVHERYFQMLKRFAMFDLGQSYYQHKSVGELVLSKMPVSKSSYSGWWRLRFLDSLTNFSYGKAACGYLYSIFW